MLRHGQVVVTDAGDTPLKPQQLLTEEEYRAMRAQYGESSFEADMGAEAACQADPALAKGVNTYQDKITYPAVAEAFDAVTGQLHDVDRVPAA